MTDSDVLASTRQTHCTLGGGVQLRQQHRRTETRQARWDWHTAHKTKVLSGSVKNNTEMECVCVCVCVRVYVCVESDARELSSLHSVLNKGIELCSP